MGSTDLLFVNFGGPRSLEEITPFLSELLTDRDLIWTRWPHWFHNAFFRWVARRRAKKIAHDYELIGGKSPIFFDTETIASQFNALTFHRYLPMTHSDALARIEASQASEIRVFPFFPQFTFATTGSIARFFKTHLSKQTLEKLRWIRSFPTSDPFVFCFQKKITSLLEANHLKEEETLLIFSAHGLPKEFVDKGDPYEKECTASFQAIAQGFPNALSRLSYQSKFGSQEWLSPSTESLCETVRTWKGKQTAAILVPLAFPSDHIETLFEIEEQYLPILRKQGMQAYRCPALNLDPEWIQGIESLIWGEGPFFMTEELIRS